MRAKYALVALGCVIATVARAQSPAIGVRPFSVTHYDAQIEPRLESRTVTGTVTLSVVMSRIDAEPADATITLDRGRLEIDSVEEGGRARAFVTDGSRLRITLPRGRANARRSLTVRYHGAPSFGLVFSAEREQIYTVFSTSQWMIALDDPGARATLRLRVTMPREWTGAANGRHVSRRLVPPGKAIVEWRVDRPVPTYTFGFAVGRFDEVEDRGARVGLTYLARDMPHENLRRVFDESARMMTFFEARAGVAYPGATYSQVLVERTAGQEMAGLSIFSEEYGRAVLADPSAVGLIAHELAHQWWGNMVTCQAWTEFWLNEGFATFMAAAYREHRFGRDVYLQDVAAMKARYEHVRARGNDRPLIFPNWDRPTADDRTLVYQKGGYALHELRERVGDAAFWAGIKRYTTEHFGRSVTTKDFHVAMERASGVDLDGFFDRWIYK
jgi:aminopeptidase N